MAVSTKQGAAVADVVLGIVETLGKQCPTMAVAAAILVTTQGINGRQAVACRAPAKAAGAGQTLDILKKHGVTAAAFETFHDDFSVVAARLWSCGGWPRE